MRDSYYDDKLHGSDWNRVRDAYRPILEDITYKEDFNALFGLVLGELNSSHVGIFGVPNREGPVTPSLGIALDDSYAGPGVKVATVVPKGSADKERSRLKPGDLLLTVDGEAVKTTEQFYRLLADKAAKPVVLTVNTEPKVEGAHTVRIRPITTAAYKQLDYDRWVSEREKMTGQLSGNKLGYIHMNAMNATTLENFKRLVYGDMQAKDGLVIDVRFNGGDSTADEILEVLETKVFGYRTLRNDTDRTTSPLLAWNKPTIVLINELSYSNAEVFPWGFKELHLGKVVGVPTNGSVIGTGATTLIDGTTLRIPSTGAFTLTGIDQERNGCPPDIYVENTPEDFARNHDRQLETAVQELLRQTKH
jgi:tricorn protease